jgi:hypothetical protein
MSGLLALLDDVATLAKLAAAQIDDVAAQAAKAGAKAAGVVIDDAAVTPKYVLGLPATRELPIVWQIARGSLFNKLVILTPAALLLSAFLPWLITALLMLGGRIFVSKALRRSGISLRLLMIMARSRKRWTQHTLSANAWLAQSRRISFCPPKSWRLLSRPSRGKASGGRQ